MNLRQAAALALVGWYLLTAFARPALAQSAGYTASKTKASILGLSPGKAFNFGKVIVGLTSAPQTVTLTNKSSTTAIAITRIVVSSPFIETGDNCGSSIAASGMCTISVAFKPTTTKKVKDKTALTFIDSAKKSPQHYELE